MVEVRSCGAVPGTATAFVVSWDNRPLLVTHWHVVAGRDPETGKALHPTAALPNELRIVHHAAAKLGSWTITSEPLYGATMKPIWTEHPHGSAIDLVALPLMHLTGVSLFPLDLALADFDMLGGVAMPVSIVGFPFGLSTAGAWPIWTTGHVASDPDLDYDGGPVFLIDATTRGGMPGSPVILRAYGGYVSSTAAMNIGGGPATRFLGVYSGRIHAQSEIGRVWRPSALREVLAGVP